MSFSPEPKRLGTSWALPSTKASEKVRALLRPLPTLGAGDQVPEDPEGSLRLGVAMDILASRTRRLESSPFILQTLAEALWDLRDSAQAEEETSLLIDAAKGPVGYARARLGQALTRTRGAVNDAHVDDIQSSAPISELYHTLALIDQAADLLVRQQTLYIRTQAKKASPRA